jgi:hypothetical protein
MHLPSMSQYHKAMVVVRRDIWSYTEVIGRYLRLKLQYAVDFEMHNIDGT